MTLESPSRLAGSECCPCRVLSERPPRSCVSEAPRIRPVAAPWQQELRQLLDEKEEVEEAIAAAQAELDAVLSSNKAHLKERWRGGVYSRFSNRSSLTGLSPGAEAERQSLAAAGGGRLHSQGGPPQAAAQPNDAQRAGDKGATGAAERRGVRVCSAASCHCVGA